MRATTFIAGLCLLMAWAGSGSLAAQAAGSDLDALLAVPGKAGPRVDLDNRPLLPDSLRDRLAVVSFVSADCTILCVTRTMDLNALARDLPASLRGRVVFLAIGMDPAGDDAARLRGVVRQLLGPAPQVRVLPSDAGTVKAVAAALHYPAASLPEPPPTILLFDRRGQAAMVYGGAPLDGPRLQRDLVALDGFTEGLDRP
ncbi:SCO family protein [Methylobacterium sp. Gmos1]